MVFECREVDQVLTIQPEGRDAVPDCLFCPGRCLVNRGPDFFKNISGILRELCDIRIDVRVRFRNNRAPRPVPAWPGRYI